MGIARDMDQALPAVNVASSTARLESFCVRREPLCTRCVSACEIFITQPGAATGATPMQRLGMQRHLRLASKCGFRSRRRLRGYREARGSLCWCFFENSQVCALNGAGPLVTRISARLHVRRCLGLRHCSSQKNSRASRRSWAQAPLVAARRQGRQAA